ncbi:MAG: hypothetical protein IJL71_02300 [Oscillospiraceae bacterium]|nr:hypothetical protein [Oscillospiraceae bacterium]
MLALCILATISVVLSFFSKSTFSVSYFNVNFDILGILTAIAFWIVYAAARSPEYEMSIGGLKFTSVIITIIKVIFWIGFGVFVVIAILCFAAPSAVSSAITVTPDSPDVLDELIPYFSNSAVVTLIGVACIFGAILFLIANIFFYGNISKSVKSIIASVEADQHRMVKLGTVSVWLIVLGILSVLVSFGSHIYAEKEIDILAVAADLVSAAMLFLGAALAKKVKDTPVPSSQAPQYTNYQ